MTKKKEVAEVLNEITNVLKHNANIYELPGEHFGRALRGLFL